MTTPPGQPPGQPQFVPQPVPMPVLAWDWLGLRAAGASLLAAILTLLGTLLPLYGVTMGGTSSVSEIENSENSGSSFDITAWGLEISGNRLDESSAGVPISGPPLVLAIVLLVVTAGVTVVGAMPGAAQGIRRAAGMLVVAGTAFLAGIGWTVVLQVSSQQDSVDAAASSPSFNVEFATGAGYWLLITAVVVAIVALVLTLLPPRRFQRAPGADLPTPPYGFAEPARVFRLANESDEQEETRPAGPLPPLPGHHPGDQPADGGEAR